MRIRLFSLTKVAYNVRVMIKFQKKMNRKETQTSEGTLH